MQNIFDRRYAGKRLFGEDAELKRECASELSFEVHGTAAHARDNPGVLDLGAFELDENDGLPRAEKIGHDPDNFEVEFLDLIAGKDGVGVTLHPRANLAERENFAGDLGACCQGKEGERARKSDSSHESGT